MHLQILADKIDRRFNKSELRDLFFKLTIDYDDLAGETRKDKIRELVQHCDRRGKTDELVQICRELRSNEPWDIEAQYHQEETLIKDHDLLVFQSASQQTSVHLLDNALEFRLEDNRPNKPNFKKKLYLDEVIAILRHNNLIVVLPNHSEQSGVFGVADLLDNGLLYSKHLYPEPDLLKQALLNFMRKLLPNENYASESNYNVNKIKNDSLISKEEESNKPLVFISYTRKDQKHAEDLYEHLMNVGLRPWMDVHDIEPGTNWKYAIERNIRSATFFIACISNNSVKKRGTIQVEIKTALETWREKLDEDAFLIPVRLEKCDVPVSLSQFQWVDLFAKGGLQKLINTLVTRSGLNEIMIPKIGSEEDALSSQDARLLRYLDLVNKYRRPRLLVEGINTDDLLEHVGHTFGKNDLSEIIIPPGDRCVYILEYRWWQGNNGSEDISDLVLDFLIFSKKAFLNAAKFAAKSQNKGFLFPVEAERIRDDGFWEDGISCFKYTHLKNVSLKIVVDIEGNVFDFVHDSEIKPALHPEKSYVDSSSIIF